MGMNRISPSASGLPSNVTVPELETSEPAHPQSSRPPANQHQAARFIVRTPFAQRRRPTLELWRDFAVRDRPAGPPDAEADVLVDKVHGAVAHEDIHPTRVPAARGSRALLLRADDAGQVELRPGETAAGGEEDVRAGAVRSRAGVNLAQARHIDPDGAAEILRGLSLGQAGEVLAKHHRVACPGQDVGQARPVIEAEGRPRTRGDLKDRAVVVVAEEGQVVGMADREIAHPSRGRAPLAVARTEEARYDDG